MCVGVGVVVVWGGSQQGERERGGLCVVCVRARACVRVCVCVCAHTPA